MTKNAQELNNARSRACDKMFQAAVLRAILDGKETCVIGVDKRPCTERPEWIRPHVVPSISSCAQLCAEIGGSARRGLNTRYD